MECSVPSYDNLIQVARSVKRDLDHDSKAFRSYERMELTSRLRTVSGEPTTRCWMKSSSKRGRYRDLFSGSLKKNGRAVFQ